MKKSYIAVIIAVLVIIVAAVGMYYILGDESKSDDGETNPPDEGGEGVYYMYFAKGDGTEIEELPDKWIKCTGDNAFNAMVSTFDANGWDYEAGDGFINSMFGLGTVQNENSEYTYWVLYVWDEFMNSFVSSPTLLPEIVSDGPNSPEYVAWVYKTYNEETDVPPTVTPADIPESVL